MIQKKVTLPMVDWKTRTILLSWTTLTAKALLLAGLLVISQSHAATRTTIAHWTFDETSGPVLNAKPFGDGEASTRHSGWTGYSADTDDDGEVERIDSRVIFNGNRDSIILIDEAQHADFNPGGGSFMITLEFLISQAALNDEALAPGETWNLIQKGRFNNAGGQWKIQIRKGPEKRLYLQCLLNDDKPDTKREAGQILLQDVWVANKHLLLGRCAVDRQANELKLGLTDLRSGKTVASVTEAISNKFGAVSPVAGKCSSPESYGGNVAIGNKPLCPDQKLDTNDAFQGEILNVVFERF